MQIGNREVVLRKVKTFIGNEGIGLNADILVDGKKIAFVRDAADGGPSDYDINGDLQTEEYQTNKKIFEEIQSLLAEMPKYEQKPYPPMQWDWDLLVNHLLQEHENNKMAAKVKRQIENRKLTAIVFGKPGELTYSYVDLKQPVSYALTLYSGKESIKNIIKKYCTNGDRVLNDNIPQELIDEALKK